MRRRVRAARRGGKSKAQVAREGGEGGRAPPKGEAPADGGAGAAAGAEAEAPNGLAGFAAALAPNGLAGFAALAPKGLAAGAAEAPKGLAGFAGAAPKGLAGAAAPAGASEGQAVPRVTPAGFELTALRWDSTCSAGWAKNTLAPAAALGAPMGLESNGLTALRGLRYANVRSVSGGEPGRRERPGQTN